MRSQTTVAAPSPTTAAPATAASSAPPAAHHSWRRLLDPHNPVALVYGVFLAIGIFFTQNRIIIPEAVASPDAAMLGFALWALYTLPWIVFISHRELFAPLSRRTAALGFLWGAFIATTVMALNANDAMISIYTKLDPNLSAQWSAALTASWVEELSCGLGIVAVLYAMRTRLRSPFEMMILGAFVGLGFQILEDWMYSANAVSQSFGQHAIVDVLQSFFVRAFIAGWWSHTLWTGLFGAGLGYLMSRDVPRKPALAALLMFSAIALHFLWDSPLLSPFGLLGDLAKGAVAVAVYIWAYRRTVSTERGWVRVALAPEVANGRIPQGDVDALATTYRKRKHEWKQLRKEQGPDAAAARREYEGALVELADALDDSRSADTPAVLAARAEVSAARTPAPAAAPSPV